MTESRPTTHRPSVSRFYRTWTLIFLGISIITGAAIAFLALSNTVVTVTLTDRDVAIETNLATEPQPTTGSPAIRGVVATATAEDTLTVTVPSAGAPVDDYARGQVTIFNHWTKIQPLAAGTRLKSASNGLIYRTTKRVDVPSGGQVDVEVVADVKGEIGNVESNRFTIVALWAGLQSDIYAENSQPLTGGSRAAGVVTQAQIDEAAKQLLAQLTSTASQKLSEPPTGLEYFGVPTVTASGTTADTKVGLEATSFQLRGSVTVSAVAIDPTVIKQRALSLMSEKLNPGEQTTSDARLDVKVKSVKKETAVVTLVATTTARLSPTAEALSTSRLTSKTKSEVNALLRALPGVSNVTVAISPFWSGTTSNAASKIKVTTLTASQ